MGILKNLFPVPHKWIYNETEILLAACSINNKISAGNCLALYSLAPPTFCFFE